MLGKQLNIFIEIYSYVARYKCGPFRKSAYNNEYTIILPKSSGKFTYKFHGYGFPRL
jgi:hypothetical protein